MPERENAPSFSLEKLVDEQDVDDAIDCIGSLKTEEFVCVQEVSVSICIVKPWVDLLEHRREEPDASSLLPPKDYRRETR